MLDYVREGAAAKVTIRDSEALIGSQDPEAVCQVHFEGWETGTGIDEGFDPEDPSTWPIEDPDFDINDPATWPYIPGTGDEPTVTPPPSHGGDEPTVTEPPAVTPHPDPEPGPDDEPYVPVGIPEG